MLLSRLNDYLVMDYPCTNNIMTNQATSNNKTDLDRFSVGYESSMDSAQTSNIITKRNFNMDLSGDWIIQFDYRLTDPGQSYSNSVIFGFGVHYIDGGPDSPIAAIEIESSIAQTTIFKFNRSIYAYDKLYLGRWHTFTLKGSPGKTEFYLDGELKSTVGSMGVQTDFYFNGKDQRYEGVTCLFRNFKFAIGVNQIYDEDKYIKMIYTPGTAQNPIGTFSKAPDNISDDLELKYIYDPNTQCEVSGVGIKTGGIRVWDWYVQGSKDKDPNVTYNVWGGIFKTHMYHSSATIINESGWFYAIDCGDVYIADRPVCIMCTYNEIQQAGYIGSNKPIHLITKNEYETYIRTNPIQTLWNNSNINYGYEAHFGEWIDEVDENEQVLIATRLNDLGTGERDDYYNTQSCSGWQPKNTRSLLTNPHGAIYVPTAFRPVFIKKTCLYNNMKIIYT